MIRSVSEIIEKRRRAWDKRHDIMYDAALVRAGVCAMLADRNLALEVKSCPWLLVEMAFTIVDKSRRTVPFFFNEVQQDFIKQLVQHRSKNKPFFVLKGRQQGFTSLITALQLAYAISMRNFAGFTIADSGDNTLAIFNDKGRMVYERLCDELKPTERFNSRNELFFDKLNSSWRIATASEQVGRSRTLNFVHFSEVAFYEVPLSSLQKGIGEALVPGAIVIYETTANGYNEAKDLWDGGKCINLFYEWWKTSEYRSSRVEVLNNISDAWLAERIEVLKALGLDENQLAWYVEKYDSYLDKNTIKQEYPMTPDEAFVSSGTCAFDKDKVVNQIQRVSSKNYVQKTGYFKYKKDVISVSESVITDIEWVDDVTGFIKIHEEPYIEYDEEGNEVRRMPYALGGDTAGLGEDFYAAKVISNIDGRTVATMHVQRTDDDLYADQIYCLGKYYHDAIIGVEINYSTAPTRELEKLRYPRLYKREIMDTSLGKTVTVHKAGFETTSRTRPVIIAEIVQQFRENPQIECDLTTLHEFLTFCKNPKGRYEAIEGKHDDLVMAKAIAHFVGRQGDRDWLYSERITHDFFDNFNINQNREGEINLWDF